MCISQVLMVDFRLEIIADEVFDNIVFEIVLANKIL